MTAMEKIKNIESPINESYLPQITRLSTLLSFSTALFLLKAFRMMREIAIERHKWTTDLVGKPNNQEFIDKEFEKRMAKE